MRDFKGLKVWVKAHALTLRVYRVTQGYPREERYALTSQLRRAASSVPTNIAEACGRNTETDFARFLDISMGSASELEYLLLLSRDLGYLSSEEHAGLSSEVQEVKKMLAGFLQRLRAE